MSYIPEDAQWYVADIIEEMRIEADPRNVVHINTVLVRANSPDEAYQRALELGQEAEYCYENTDGRMVSVIFRGLGQLSVVHDELEHGAELLYREKIDFPEEEIRSLVAPKEQLGVFAPRRPPSGPNYMPNSVMKDLERMGFDSTQNQDCDS